MSRIQTFIAGIALTLLGSTTPALAENMFDTSSGELVLPVLEVGAEQRFFARFTLLSNSPYRWQLAESAAVTASSRVAAEYRPETASLWVPEITIDGQLYSLAFTVLSDCAEGVCLEPQLESLADMGRSGAQIFTTVASSNSTFTCSTCHALSETDGFAADGLRRPGNPLLNVTKRPHYKGGELSSLREAINICRTEWMNTTAWEASNQEWINLMNWLDDQATVEVAEPVDLAIVAPVEVLTGGSVEDGHALFNKSCAVCHGENGLGTELAPKVSNTGLQAAYIAQRIRHSGRSNSLVYPGLAGGIMPFWTETRLNNVEMVNIIAYLESGESDPVSSGGSNGGSSGSSSDSSCTSDHAKIGQTAELSTLFHAVAGTAVIVDDCTIEIRNFSFDGGGINVHVYAGTNQQFHTSQGGFSLKSGLLGTAYNNATFTITLPDGVSLDDFDSISIWCVPVGVSFGHGQFTTPPEDQIPGIDLPDVAVDDTY